MKTEVDAAAQEAAQDKKDALRAVGAGGGFAAGSFASVCCLMGSPATFSLPCFCVPLATMCVGGLCGQAAGCFVKPQPVAANRQ
jgi:hypothetical protein